MAQSTVDDLYDTDFLLWTQEQAAALRAAAKAGGKSNAVEWERIAEEIEDMGESEYREAASLVARIIEHFYKLAWSQREEPKVGWTTEIDVFRLQLAGVLTTTLKAKLDDDLDRLHRLGAKQAEVSFLTHEPNTARDPSLRWDLTRLIEGAAPNDQPSSTTPS